MIDVKRKYLRELEHVWRHDESSSIRAVIDAVLSQEEDNKELQHKVNDLQGRVLQLEELLEKAKRLAQKANDG